MVLACCWCVRPHSHSPATLPSCRYPQTGRARRAAPPRCRRSRTASLMTTAKAGGHACPAPAVRAGGRRCSQGLQVEGGGSQGLQAAASAARACKQGAVAPAATGWAADAEAAMPCHLVAAGGGGGPRINLGKLQTASLKRYGAAYHLVRRGTLASCWPGRSAGGYTALQFVLWAATATHVCSGTRVR